MADSPVSEVKASGQPRADVRSALWLTGGALAYTAITTAVAIYSGSIWWLVAALCTCLVAALGAMRRRHAIERAASPLIAHLPYALAILALLAYSAVLTDVHRSSLSGAQLRSIARNRSVISEIRRLDQRQTVLNSRLQQSNGELKAALQGARSSAPGKRPPLPIVEKLATLAHASTQFFQANEGEWTRNEARIVQLTREERGPPSEYILPAWFGRLSGFFTLAAQLLFGLIVALWLEKRAAAEAPAVALLRLNLLTTGIGLVAALVGTLPDLSRPLQAFLLAFVTAGLVSSVAALAVRAVLGIDHTDPTVPMTPAAPGHTESTSVGEALADAERATDG